MRPISLLLALAACTSTADKPDDTDTDTDTVDTDSAADDTGPDTDAAHAPSAPVIALSPTAPPAGVDLTVVIVTPSVDPDGDDVSYRYAWTEAGAARPDLTGDTVPGTETTDGEVWTVTVTPTDGTLDGPSADASVTIGNTAPTAPGLSFDPAAPEDHDTLTLVFDPPATDPDGDPLTTSITWYEDDSLNTVFTDATTVDGRYVGGGETFRAVVSVTDGYHDPVVTEASVTVANTPPTLDHPHIEPTSPADDDDLVVTGINADDADGNDLALTYVWYRDGVEATDVGNVDTVPAAATAVDESWSVTVTVSDGTDTATDSADPVTIIPWEGAVYYRTFTARISPDGSTATGSWSLDMVTHGGRYGENDCDLLWQIDAGENARLCPRCDYAFQATYTLDASSVVTTGSTCTGDAADATGDFTYRIGGSAFSATLYVGYSSYYYYYYYGYYGDSMYFSGTGHSYYGYYGVYDDYHTVSTSTDTAGYTTLSAYEAEKRYY
jgi:hypothetical protein